MALNHTILCRTLTLSSQLRYPSIKFRYGPKRDQHQNQNPNKGAASQGGGQKPPQQEAAYDFQLPARFKRRPISEEEIAYINRGGPE